MSLSGDDKVLTLNQKKVRDRSICCSKHIYFKNYKIYG